MTRESSDQATTTTSETDGDPSSIHWVTHADLPLSCPTPSMSLWNAHPRVYLPIESTGQAKCPYCGAEYRLSDKPG